MAAALAIAPIALWAGPAEAGFRYLPPAEKSADAGSRGHGGTARSRPGGLRHGCLAGT